MGDDDPFGSYGLSRVRLEDKPVFDRFFTSCSTRLSDYSFANTFVWRDSIHLRWRVLHDRLCVFANGEGGLTLLFPPLGPGDFRAAVREALAICEAYNHKVGFTGVTRVEYVSQEILETFGEPFEAEPMSGDYLYATARMIDLEGSDLASKRQARNRFARRYAARTEPFGPQHVDECLRLLRLWHCQHEDSIVAGSPSIRIKRAKEEAATAEAIRHAHALGLTGMVLYAGEPMVGFTFSERLGADTCSILIEKTDREFVGSAQYIFSEFCRQYWSDTTWCNVGDDWEIPSLAWTKHSYRPAGRLAKWTVRPLPSATVVWPGLPAETEAPLRVEPPTEPSPAPAAEPRWYLDRADLKDLEELRRIETQCFDEPLALTRRQLRYLLRSPHVTTHVVRQDGHVVAEAIVLRRRTARGVVGRIYTLAVDATRRSHGMGRALLCNCVETLHREGALAVVLEVALENTAAQALYERSGFARVSQLADYYAPGRDAWKMRLELQPKPALLNV